MATIAAPTVKPTAECDVVMKGGITSGVIYPRALRVLATQYRFRGMGGASAGAIGAALGAAAEHGRASGGFDVLDGLPAEMGNGKLAQLFQPQRTTKPLFGLMLVATGSDRAGPPRKGIGKVLAIIWQLIKTFPVAGLIGIAPGVAAIVVGVVNGGLTGWLLAAAGVVLAKLGWLVAILWRLYRLFTVQLPANRFGICAGLSTKPGQPGFTDWLSERIDTMAGLTPAEAPLTFGRLWAGTSDASTGQPRDIDLRLITTCLTEGRPFEMPFEARRFFFDPVEWRALFPGYVVDALERAPAAAPEQADDTSDDPIDEPDPGVEQSSPEYSNWDLETEHAKRRGLVRLPDAEHLPVIVATRMSLSFPLLISAIPLHTINRRDPKNQEAAKLLRTNPDAAMLQFSRVWFTDGGLCSNFPVQLFDSALPSRPTFAINLGSFPSGREPNADQTKNIEWAKNNRSGLLPAHTDIAESGLAAVTSFASAALNTARNWQDSSHLDHPGYRDRIVRVLQTKREGGMNLRMDTQTIDNLSERGGTAAQVMIDQFNQPHYANGGSGWDNHRWVRFRALLSVLPDWAASYQRGFAALQIDQIKPPSYKMSREERELAERMTTALSQLATEVGAADDTLVDSLTSTPRPKGRLRRIPQI